MNFVRDKNKGSKKLWYCETMWTRLHAYASLVILFEHRIYLAIREPLFHVSEYPNAPELPPPSYEDGYRQMHVVDGIQSIPSQPISCNTEGVQDAVNSQILDMCHENKATDFIPETDYINTANEKVEDSDAKASSFHPTWFQSCYYNHITKHSKTAGFTDSMLFVSPARLDRDYPKHTQVALQGGKTSWVYTTANYQEILRGTKSIITGIGAFCVLENVPNGNLLLCVSCFLYIFRRLGA
ncbi:hypothetical protein DFS33DRAFT_1383677 [Desarmillaria ectypa]|nr:hypothetical protein DFS33DRAFT_1383677 [Desarmillaria ectypa]